MNQEWGLVGTGPRVTAWMAGCRANPGDSGNGEGLEAILMGFFFFENVLGVELWEEILTQGSVFEFCVSKPQAKLPRRTILKTYSPQAKGMKNRPSFLGSPTSPLDRA